MIKKLFGEIKMTWLTVILFAIGTAIMTAVFLLIPALENTSFERMGVHFEAWILFAVIIMSNCKKPLESAFKTFVFFLISQPLIYLIQVPFSHMGWALFGYYKYWFICTLLTFPAAFIGWFITKKNWISLLILLPVLGYLTYIYVDRSSFAVNHFPYQIITALFCLAQVVLYVYVFTSNIWQKLIGVFVPLAAVIMYIIVFKPPTEINSNFFLPDSPVLTDKAVVELEENSEDVNIDIGSIGKDSSIYIHSTKFGDTDFKIKDNNKEYNYTLHIYEDNNGSTQIEVFAK